MARAARATEVLYGGVLINMAVDPIGHVLSWSGRRQLRGRPDSEQFGFWRGRRASYADEIDTFAKSTYPEIAAGQVMDRFS